MDIATIIGDYCSAPFPEYFLIKHCYVCAKDLSDGVVDKDGGCGWVHAGCVCVPTGYDDWKVEDLWESGYCGKMCCCNEACMGAFVGKRIKDAEKCIACYALVNLDTNFDEHDAL